MPRPSNRPTGAVWRLLEAWSESHPLQPNQSQMARFFEISGSLLSNWKYVDSLMQTDDIALVAEKTGLPFEEVARAAAEDAPLARQAAARRREADLVITDDDGNITVIEVKGSGAVGQQGLPKAARRMTSAGRAARAAQDAEAEAGEAWQEDGGEG